jgi:hypothetical protein
MKRIILKIHILCFVYVFLLFYFAFHGRTATYFLCFVHAKRTYGE